MYMQDIYKRNIVISNVHVYFSILDMNQFQDIRLKFRLILFRTFILFYNHQNMKEVYIITIYICIRIKYVVAVV